MVFDIRRVSEAVNNVTLEIICSIIWNSERLKKIIEILAENEDYRQSIKEIEDLPIEVVLSQYLYKLNGEVRRLNEERITKILNTLGSELSESSGLEVTFTKIDQTLEEMNEEWEKISERFRYQSCSTLLYEIVEGFLHMNNDKDSFYYSKGWTASAGYGSRPPNKDSIVSGLSVSAVSNPRQNPHEDLSPNLSGLGAPGNGHGERGMMLQRSSELRHTIQEENTEAEDDENSDSPRETQRTEKKQTRRMREEEYQGNGMLQRNLERDRYHQIAESPDFYEHSDYQDTQETEKLDYGGGIDLSNGVTNYEIEVKYRESSKRSGSPGNGSGPNTGRNAASKADVVTFGGLSNRFVKVSSSVNLEQYSEGISQSPGALNHETIRTMARVNSNEPYSFSKTLKTYGSMKNFENQNVNGAMRIVEKVSEVKQDHYPMDEAENTPNMMDLNPKDSHHFEQAVNKFKELQSQMKEHSAIIEVDNSGDFSPSVSGQTYFNSDVPTSLKISGLKEQDKTIETAKGDAISPRNYNTPQNDQHKIQIVPVEGGSVGVVMVDGKTGCALSTPPRPEGSREKSPMNKPCRPPNSRRGYKRKNIDFSGQMQNNTQSDYFVPNFVKKAQKMRARVEESNKKFNSLKNKENKNIGGLSKEMENGQKTGYQIAQMLIARNIVDGATPEGGEYGSCNQFHHSSSSGSEMVDFVALHQHSGFLNDSSKLFEKMKGPDGSIRKMSNNFSTKYSTGENLLYSSREFKKDSLEDMDYDSGIIRIDGDVKKDREASRSRGRLDILNRETSLSKNQDLRRRTTGGPFREPLMSLGKVRKVPRLQVAGLQKNSEYGILGGIASATGLDLGASRGVSRADGSRNSPHVIYSDRKVETSTNILDLGASAVNYRSKPDNLTLQSLGGLQKHLNVIKISKKRYGLEINPHPPINSPGGAYSTSATPRGPPADLIKQTTPRGYQRLMLKSQKVMHSRSISPISTNNVSKVLSINAPSKPLNCQRVLTFDKTFDKTELQVSPAVRVEASRGLKYKISSKIGGVELGRRKANDNRVIDGTPISKNRQLMKRQLKQNKMGYNFLDRSVDKMGSGNGIQGKNPAFKKISKGFANQLKVIHRESSRNLTSHQISKQNSQGSSELIETKDAPNQILRGVAVSPRDKEIVIERGRGSEELIVGKNKKKPHKRSSLDQELKKVNHQRKHTHQDSEGAIVSTSSLSNPAAALMQHHHFPQESRQQSTGNLLAPFQLEPSLASSHHISPLGQLAPSRASTVANPSTAANHHTSMLKGFHNDKVTPSSDILKDVFDIQHIKVGDIGLNDLKFVNSKNFYGASIEGDIYAFQIAGDDTERDMEVSTLDHIKDLVVDSEHHILFTQLQSGVFLAGVNGNKFISTCSQTMLPTRALCYIEDSQQLLVVSGNQRVESYSQADEYKQSSYLVLDIPEDSGDIRHLVPGMTEQTKAFILTDSGEIVHIGMDEGIAHIQLDLNGKDKTLNRSIIDLPR